MVESLGYALLAGLGMAAICKKARLPRIVGMLAVGVLLGPYALNALDPALLGVSAQLRQIALIIILIKAGLSLNLDDLRAVGRPAALMSFLPATFEIAGVMLFAPPILHVSVTEAAIMGAVLGAVSPAVVVPQMVKLMEEGYGEKKRVPQLILAGASLDDVFVIVLFTAFVGLEQGEGVSIWAFARVPVSIAAGVTLGAATGWGLHAVWSKRRPASRSMETVVALGAAFLLTAVETRLENVLPVSGLLAVMSMAVVLRRMEPRASAQGMVNRFGEMWLAAEVLLFVLVGAAVDIRYTMEAGAGAIALIFLALGARSIGVWLSLVKTPLNRRERLFCVIAYLPKATVQAAIGGVPLALGLPCGKLVLSTAALAILITAPLGAIGMEQSYRKLLERSEK